MDIRRVLILLEKEFLEFSSGKAWVIALILPLFITFLFATVYREPKQPSFRLGMVGSLDPALVRIISESDFKIRRFQNFAHAKDHLKTAKIDGIIYPHPTPKRFVFLVKGSEIAKASLAANAINATLIHLYSRENIPQIELRTSGKTVKDLTSLALPMWLVQIILTLCLLQTSAAIAEEKSKHTLHALLVSPATLPDYCASKIIWNTCLGLSSILVTTWLTHFTVNPAYLISFSILGCVIYTCSALLIALISPQPLLARTISTVFYLVSALPLMLKNAAISWKNLLNFLPTFPVVHGLEAAVLQNPWQGESFYFLAILAAESLILMVILNMLLKNNLDF